MDVTPGRTTRRRGRWAAILMISGAAALALPSCGGDSSGGTGDIALQWVFTPSPATAVPSDDGFDWVARYRVTLDETSGNQGATVTNVNINTYEYVDGEAGAEAAGANTVLEFESQRIEPRGSLALDFSTHYTLANEGRAAIIDAFVFVVDDEGFQAQIGRRLEVQ